jgi:ribosomal protein S18 acetylase RimI-like enzyme
VKKNKICRQEFNAFVYFFLFIIYDKIKLGKMSIYFRGGYMLTFLNQTNISARLMEPWRKNYNILHYAMNDETFQSELEYYNNVKYGPNEDKIKDKVYAVYNEETLIGYVVLNICNCQNKKSLIINHIVVNPDFMNLGYGRQILNQIIKRETEDCVQIECIIDDSNKYAINLFESVGFIRFDSNDNVGYYRYEL